MYICIYIYISAVLTCAFPPLVLADAAAAAVFAVGARRCHCSPQSLQVRLCRWCLQGLLTPQSLHLLLYHWCPQRLLPPQSLHRLLLGARTDAGLLAEEGWAARAAAWPDELSTPRSSFRRLFLHACPPTARCHRVLFLLPASDWPSALLAWPNMLLSCVSSFFVKFKCLLRGNLNERSKKHSNRKTPSSQLLSSPKV